MAAIDGFKHTLVGYVSCPSRYPVIEADEVARDIPLYRLEEDADAEPDFLGKAGDYLLGGGGGECAVLRVSMPEAVEFFTGDLSALGDFRQDRYFKAYWSLNEAFVFGDGYVRLGWDPRRHVLETWLAEHIVAWASRWDRQVAARLGKLPFSLDGGIIRTP